MNNSECERATTIKQIIQNMIEAGTIKPEETERLTEQLKKLDPKDLLTVSQESNKWKRK